LSCLFADSRGDPERHRQVLEGGILHGAMVEGVADEGEEPSVAAAAFQSPTAAGEGIDARLEAALAPRELARAHRVRQQLEDAHEHVVAEAADQVGAPGRGPSPSLRPDVRAHRVCRSRLRRQMRSD